MKKILFALTILVGLSTSVFAQDHKSAKPRKATAQKQTTTATATAVVKSEQEIRVEKINKKEQQKKTRKTAKAAADLQN